MSQMALQSSIARKAGPTWAASRKTFNNIITSTTNNAHPPTTHSGPQTSQEVKAAHCVGETTPADSPSHPLTTPLPPPKQTSSTLSFPHSTGSRSQKNGIQLSLKIHPGLRGARRTTSSKASCRMHPQALSTFGGTLPAKGVSPSKAIPPPPLGSFPSPHSSAISMEIYRPT